MDDDIRVLFLSFISKLTLCHDMGDIINDINFVLKEMGYDFKWKFWSELHDWLKNELGIAPLNCEE